MFPRQHSRPFYCILFHISHHIPHSPPLLHVACRWKHGVRSALNAFGMFKKTDLIAEGEVIWQLLPEEVAREAEVLAEVRAWGGGDGGGMCARGRAAWDGA